MTPGLARLFNALVDAGHKPKKAGKEWEVKCPAHEDERASLRFGQGDKGAVVKCHAGCATPDVLAAVGLCMTDLFDEAAPIPTQGMGRDVVAQYDYEDEQGKLLFQVQRLVGKHFRQRRPIEGDRWEYSLGDTRRVLYRLRAVRHAVLEGQTIILVEGEKDVHTAEKLGFVATCNPGGAGKWRTEYAESLQGAHLVLIPDNDQVGKDHMDSVVEALREHVRSIRVVHLPVDAKGDLTEWYTKGGTQEKLQALIDRQQYLPDVGPQIYTAPQLMAGSYPDTVFAVPGLICEGVTLLVGAPKIGKSWMSLQLGIAVAAGTKALNTIPVEAGKVLYLALEDTPRRLQSRMQMMLQDEAPANLHFANRWPRMNDGGVEMLEQWLMENTDARMVIIDTWAKVKGGYGEESMYLADYAAVVAVKQLADRYCCPIVLIHHRRKAADSDPLNTVSGSTGLTGAADATIILTRERGADEGILYVTGRDVEETRRLVSFDGETGQWTDMGEAEEVANNRLEESIVQLLADSPEPLGPKAIADALDVPEGTAKWKVTLMAEAGVITRVSRGKYTVMNVPDGMATVVHDQQMTIDDPLDWGGVDEDGPGPDAPGDGDAAGA